jgi:hypothetical protein
MHRNQKHISVLMYVLFIYSILVMSANTLACEAVIAGLDQSTDNFAATSCSVSSKIHDQIIDKENGDDKKYTKKIKAGLSRLKEDYQADYDANVKKMTKLSRDTESTKSTINSDSDEKISNSNKKLDDYIKTKNRDTEEKVKQYPDKDKYYSDKRDEYIKIQQVKAENYQKTQNERRVSKIAKLEANKDKKTASLESENLNKKRAIINIQNKGLQIAMKSVKAECRGAFKKAVFKEGQMKTISSYNSNDGDSYKWKESINGVNYDRSVNAKNALGVFASAEQAQTFIDGMYKNDPNTVYCKIDVAKEKELISVPKKLVYKNQNISKINQAGDAFPPNGMSLDTQNSSAIKQYDDNAQKWNQELKPFTDDFGRKVERSLKEVKIYSCASMVTNCSKHKTDFRDNKVEDSCEMIDFMREAFMDTKFSLTKMKNLVNGSNTYPGNSDKGWISAFDKMKEKANKDGNGDKYDSMLKKLFADKSPFVKSVKELGKQDESYNDEIKAGLFTSSASLSSNAAEQLTFLALSSMRGISMAEEFKKSVGAGDDVKVTVIPTGHPNDPFNNGKLDPRLAGTCGPPPSTGSFYGKCNKPSSCTEYSKQCSEVNTHYNTAKIKAKLDQRFQDSYLGEKYKKDPNSLSQSEKHNFHRYYQIEPIVEETVHDEMMKDVERKRFIVSCRGIKFSCKDTAPDFSTSSFGIGKYGKSPKRGKTGTAHWGSTACPSF